MKGNILQFFICTLAFCLFPFCTKAFCDCGSTDAENPCTGQSISVNVTAGNPNGGTAYDNIYNWSFNSGGGNAKCGQFANGDYWIAPAEGQTNVTITNVTTTSPGDIAVDVNPEMEALSLIGKNKSYGNYDASKNIIPNLPQNYSGITSLVAGIERNEAVEGSCGTASIVGGCADSYDVITILDSVPENSGATVIRPNITGDTKEMLTFSDFDFTRIPAESFLTGADIAGYENIRRRWSHSTEIFGLMNASGTGYSEGGRAFRSHTLIDDYGGGMASVWNGNMMNIFSDENSFEEKKAALAAMLSYGLDLYHAMYDAPNGVIRSWGTGATQHPGRFLPAVFLAALMNDQSYANNLKTVSSHIHDTTYMGPPELAQLHDSVNGPVWGDIPGLTGKYFQGSYWANLMSSQCYDGATGTCNSAIGSKTMYDPYGYIDGPPNKPGTSYMLSSLGIQKSFMASMCLMPEIRAIVNYPNLITYIDRINNYGLKTANDPCVTPDSREDFENCDAYRNTGCLYYGVTWGPVDINDQNSDCIKTPTPPYNKVGRFTDLDGNPITPSYVVWPVENNWEEIRSLCVGLTFRADVDNSSVVTTSDALLTLRNSLGLDMSGTAWQTGATTGDVNCDSVSNSADALLILRYSLGLSMGETSWCEE